MPGVPLMSAVGLQVDDLHRSVSGQAQPVRGHVHDQGVPLPSLLVAQDGIVRIPGPGVFRFRAELFPDVGEDGATRGHDRPPRA